MFITRNRIMLTLAAATLALAGCGDDSADDTSATTTQTGSPTTSATAATRSDFNDADVMFLQMMYPHHEQAVDMAEMVPQRSQNPELLALATAIEQAQGPEMQQMTALLQSFGKPAPTDGDHGDHGDHQMPGMMSDEQMDALEAANGEEFDRMWLEMMIAHHQGAIDMADTEIADGQNADAKALAESIKTTQQAEIDQMNGMLGGR